MVQPFGFRNAPLSSLVAEIKECLAGQFGYVGFGVPKQRHQHANPTQFARFNADDGNGIGHAHTLSDFFSTAPAQSIEEKALLQVETTVFAILSDKKKEEALRQDAEQPFKGTLMDISGVNRSGPGVPASVPVAPAENHVQNREVIQAVKALNATEMFGDQNELLFQQDPQTHRMVVRVVNRQTKEVVSQIPAEYVLQLAAGLKPQTISPGAL